MNEKEKDYYTATEAMKLLGLARASFYERVNAGQIRKMTLPGRKQGVYVREDIDALAEALNLVFAVPPERIEFSRSTYGQQKEEMEIGIRCFGSEYITPLKERVEFQDKSEYTFWSLKVDRRVVGYVSMFRFPPEFLDDILVGRHIERDITPREVLRFKRLEPFDIYIDVMAVDPRLSPHQQKYYGGIIVKRFIRALLNLKANGFQIERMYTVTASPEGDKLVRDLGFKLMAGKSQAPGRIAYVYELDEPGMAHLQKWAQIPKGEMV